MPSIADLFNSRKNELYQNRGIDANAIANKPKDGGIKKQVKTLSKSEFETYEKNKLRKAIYELEVEQKQLEIDTKQVRFNRFEENKKKLEENLKQLNEDITKQKALEAAALKNE